MSAGRLSVWTERLTHEQPHCRTPAYRTGCRCRDGAVSRRTVRGHGSYSAKIFPSVDGGYSKYTDRPSDGRERPRRRGRVHSGTLRTTVWSCLVSPAQRASHAMHASATAYVAWIRYGSGHAHAVVCMRRRAVHPITNQPSRDGWISGGFIQAEFLIIGKLITRGRPAHRRLERPL